jgi:hypothetical protein
MIINTEEDRQRAREWIEDSNIKELIKAFHNTPVEYHLDREKTKDLSKRLLGWSTCSDARRANRKRSRLRQMIKDIKIWLI